LHTYTASRISPEDSFTAYSHGPAAKRKFRKANAPSTGRLPLRQGTLEVEHWLAYRP